MVYGWAGWSNSSSTGACSIIWPAYMTSTRSAICATSPMSWVISSTDMPSSSFSSRISSIICAWIVTSSAVVGSSATRREGLQDRAMAIITRWRMPPESRWGYRRITAAASGSPTFLRSIRARAAASSFPNPMWTRMLSVIWFPMVNTGFKDVRGSWKIMVSLSPLIWSSSFSVMASRFFPSNSTRPEVTEPPLPRRPMMDRDVTLFPHPDSPTIQTTSPGST